MSKTIIVYQNETSRAYEGCILIRLNEQQHIYISTSGIKYNGDTRIISFSNDISIQRCKDITIELNDFLHCKIHNTLYIWNCSATGDVILETKE